MSNYTIEFNEFTDIVDKSSGYNTIDGDSIIINDYITRKEYKDILMAKDYYNNKCEIDNKSTTTVINGKVTAKRLLSNERLGHAKFKKLVRQKVSYSFSDPYTLTMKGGKYKGLTNTINSYFDYDFFNTLNDIAKDAIVTGTGWLQVYYEIDGSLNFRRIDPEIICPLYSDRDKTKLNKVLLFWKETDINNDGQLKDIYYTEEYTKYGIIRYKSEQGYIGNTSIEKSAYLSIDGIPNTFNIVPFIPFQYNSDGTSLLVDIKSLIDVYDKMTSIMADMLIDTPNNILVVKNAGDTNAEEFVHNLGTYGLAMFTSMDNRADAGIDVVKNNIDSTAAESFLTRLDNDITYAANGVKIESRSGNTPETEILSFFSDMTMDCKELENNFRNSLLQLINFIFSDIMLKNSIKIPKDFQMRDITITFNHSSALTEPSLINAIISLKDANLISTATAIEQIPFVDDVEQELKRIIIEKEVTQNDTRQSNNGQPSNGQYNQSNNGNIQS